MRRFQLFIILLAGGLTVFDEFRNIKESTMFGIEMFEFVPMILLCILTVVYLIKNINQHTDTDTRNIICLIPSLLGLLFLVLTFGHMLIRSNLDNSKTFFTATTNDVGSDGGFTLDFKTNSHLKGEKIDRFSTTSYWGSYTKLNDTIKLDIPTDFKMGRVALLKKDTLSFLDDTSHFLVYKP
jgi:hypothetical protein